MTDPSPGWDSAAIDREIVMSRVVTADRTSVFRAWTDPEQIPLWFGPDGFHNVTEEIDIRPGGLWRFTMVAPDGTRFSNRMDFLRIEPDRLIDFLHGADRDDDPDRFRMLVTFESQDDGKTVLTLRQMHPTPERRAVVIGFGAVEYGAQTWAKLARHVESQVGQGA